MTTPVPAPDPGAPAGPPPASVPDINLHDLIDYPVIGPVENLVIALLKPITPFVPGLRITPWVENAESGEFATPYMTVRREPGAFASDSFGDPEPRFIQRAVITISTFTDDPDGDEKGAWLQAIARGRLLTAWLRQEVVPGLGHLGKVKESSPAHRTNDWATSTGVVQYANLPKNMHRYEATYGIALRPALSSDAQRPDPFSIFQSQVPL